VCRLKLRAVGPNISAVAVSPLKGGRAETAGGVVGTVSSCRHESLETSRGRAGFSLDEPSTVGAGGMPERRLVMYSTGSTPGNS